MGCWSVAIGGGSLRGGSGQVATDFYIFLNILFHRPRGGFMLRSFSRVVAYVFESRRSFSPFSYGRYFKLSKTWANELRGTAISELEFFERLNNTTLTNAKHSIRNTDFCWFWQYFRDDFGISQIPWEVLHTYVTVSFSIRGYCIFESRFLETL